MAKTEQIERAQWGSRVGFILAAMGSAVGFGSLARFPMNVATNGGAIFVIIYAAIMLLVGVPMLMAEFGLGRRHQTNTVGTFKKATGNPRTNWRIAGWFWFIVPSLLLAWYAIVSGWMLRLAIVSLGGAYFDNPGDYVANMVDGPGALVWAFIVLALGGAVVVFGVAKGIERLNLVLMPTLFAMVIGLAIYALFLPGNGPGYTFYMQPDLGAVNLGTITAAVGQAFFSLSLAMGAILIYASYLGKESSLSENAFWVSGSTLVFAIIAGFMIFPMIASFGNLETAQEEAGLGLILGPLTQVFSQMGTQFGMLVGIIVATIFFFAVFFASFTSVVSLSEPAIAYFSEELRITRKRAVAIVLLLIFNAGIVVAFSEPLLDLIGGPYTDVQVIVGGLILALFVGWFIPKPEARAQMDECKKGLRLSWYAYPLVKYVMPGVLTILLFFSVLGTPCLLSGGGEGLGLIETTNDFGSPDNDGEGLRLLGCDPGDPARGLPGETSGNSFFATGTGMFVLGGIILLIVVLAALFYMASRRTSNPYPPGGSEPDTVSEE